MSRATDSSMLDGDIFIGESLPVLYMPKMKHKRYSNLKTLISIDSRLKSFKKHEKRSVQKFVQKQ